MQIWDRTALLKRVRDREDRLNQLVQLFVDDMPDRIVSLVAALRDKDFETITSVTHTIKGVAGNLAAERLHHLAAIIEKAAKQQDSSNLDDYIAATEQHSADIFRVLNQQLGVANLMH